jgi:hypothetical protein
VGQGCQCINGSKRRGLSRTPRRSTIDTRYDTLTSVRVSTETTKLNMCLYLLNVDFMRLLCWLRIKQTSKRAPLGRYIPPCCLQRAVRGWPVGRSWRWMSGAVPRPGGAPWRSVRARRGAGPSPDVCQPLAQNGVSLRLPLSHWKASIVTSPRWLVDAGRTTDCVESAETGLMSCPFADLY